MKYDIDYFINKFDRIPEEMWCVGSFTDSEGRHCVLGHCGVGHFFSRPIEVVRLYSLVKSVVFLNDGLRDTTKYGSTPKQRILTRLTELKFEELGL